MGSRAGAVEANADCGKGVPLLYELVSLDAIIQYFNISIAASSVIQQIDKGTVLRVV